MPSCQTLASRPCSTTPSDSCPRPRAAPRLRIDVPCRPSDSPPRPILTTVAAQNGTCSTARCEKPALCVARTTHDAGLAIGNAAAPIWPPFDAPAVARRGGRAPAAARARRPAAPIARSSVIGHRSSLPDDGQRHEDLPEHDRDSVMTATHPKQRETSPPVVRTSEIRVRDAASHVTAACCERRWCRGSFAGAVPALRRQTGHLAFR